MEICLSISHSWRVSASSCSIDPCVRVFCCPWVILKPTAAAKLSCMMLSRCPSTVAALICHHTSSSASVHIHIEKHTFSVYQCLHTYFLWVFFVAHTHTHAHICQGHSDCFLIKSNVTVISENVPVYWMSVWRGHAHIRWPMEAVQKKLNEKKFTYFLCLNPSIGCLMWYWSIIELTCGETVSPVNTRD